MGYGGELRSHVKFIRWDGERKPVRGLSLPTISITFISFSSASSASSAVSAKY